MSLRESLGINGGILMVTVTIGEVLMVTVTIGDVAGIDGKGQ